jgi:hypothetical protein
MDRNHSQAGARRLNSQSRARHSKLSDEELETIAVAFGSHLIRNSPPREGPITPSRVGWKLGRK